MEIKSSNVNTHKSISTFCKKYSKKVYRQYLFSQKDAGHMEQLIYKPIYMLPFVLEDLTFDVKIPAVRPIDISGLGAEVMDEEYE